MNRKHSALTAAVLLYLGMSALPVSAMYTENVSYGGEKTIEYDLMAPEDVLWFDDLNFGGEYEISPAMQSTILSSGSYWGDMLMPRSKAVVPWQILITTRQSFDNANGITYDYVDGIYGYYEMLNSQIQTGSYKGEHTVRLEVSQEEPSSEGLISFSVLTLGENLGAARPGAERGWWYNTETVLPDNQQATDLAGCIRHELGHALGISVYPDTWTSPGEYKFYTEDDFVEWAKHLHDQNLNPAREGMRILTSGEYKELKADDPDIRPEDYFIVDNIWEDDMESLRIENPRAGYAYFMGDHVSEVLDGKTFFGVDGLPVNGWEGRPELSHIQLNGLMSHRYYANYATLMEAELAAMQDLGYDFDRRAYYGYSLYKDNQTLVNTHGYSARNAEGTAYLPGVYSQVPLGVGLHIYGTGNTVTQAADILTQGTGAAGIRVDGMENRLIIPKGTEIHSDGRNGRGILFAYGRNHNLTQEGTVTARGEKGDAVTFDFGSSTNGAFDDYRGSFIRYIRALDNSTGEITSTANKELEKDSYINYDTTELAGAMTDQYNLSGTLEAGRNAIRIGKSAFVDTINVLDGAKIKGDIVSDWKHLNEENDGIFATDDGEKQALALQYKGGSYNYTQYIPELVTKLNFQTTDALSYDGNISGPDNIKLRVDSGALLYGGTADVVNVEVAKGAALQGGSFIVNDMTDGHYMNNGVGVTLAEGFTDDTTGQLINHGTIGAAAPVNSDTSMNITGQLVSDGNLQMTANGCYKGYIDVKNSADGKITGAVEDKGSHLSIDPKGKYLPEENYLDFVRLNGEVQKLDYVNTAVDYKTGMLTAVYDKTEGTLSFERQNNMGALTATENQTLRDMNDMFDGLSKEGRQEMAELYNLSPEDTKNAFADIYNPDSARASVSAVQQGTFVSTAVHARMVQTRNSGGSLRAVSRMGDSEVIPMGETDSFSNGGWMKFSKNWGRLSDGAATLHGSAMTFGYDRRVSDSWRVGALVSYNKTSFGSSRASLKTDDWRFGVYGGYHKGPHDAYIYADYGWQRNEQKRSVISRRAEADYNGRLLELGGEYTYDLHAEDGRIWHVSPYVGLQLSRYSQSGYRENGAGVYDLNAQGMNNTYIAGMAGLELRRELSDGSFMLRGGLKHAFRGTDPRLSFNYSGLPDRRRDISDSRDATMAAFALSYTHSIGSNWRLQADAQLERGPHDRNIMGSLMLQKEW